MTGEVVHGLHIVRTPGICGGAARIAGTRIAIEWCADMLKSPEGVRLLMDLYPSVHPVAIMEAIQYVYATGSAQNAKLVATWECVVIETNGDLVYCDAYPLDKTKDRELWEVEVPENRWTEGHVFYVVHAKAP